MQHDVREGYAVGPAGGINNLVQTPPIERA